MEGLKVLDRIGETPLIISDMRMPDLDGMGFLEAVRQRFPDSSVIMLSGHQRDDDRGRLPPSGSSGLPAEADLPE